MHLLHEPGFDPAGLARLEAWLTGLGAGLTLHEIEDERVAGLPTEGFTGKATWYRILLPELLPEVDRVLFLDGDVLVLDALDELWATDLDGVSVAAVTNVFPPMYAGRWREIGLATPDAYFNAGVLLMNLDALREQDAPARLRAYGTEHADTLVLRDQDALNAVLADRRLALHPRWNVMNIMRFEWADEVFGADVVAEARQRPAIRHFEGPDDNKPWHPACDRDDRDAYFAHRRATPWPRVRGLRRARLAAAAGGVVKRVRR